MGGVILNVKSKEEVKQAFADIRAKLAAMGKEEEMEGVTVQKMISAGVETIVGMTQDAAFGPVILFGVGGVYAELLKETALRLHPLTDLDARELIGSVCMQKLFEGFRGAPPSDIDSLQDLLLRVSAMVEDVPEISEMDLNPVKVMPKGGGYWVVDFRVMLK